ncbi:alpha/beta fold hydrolase [Actinokineospora bangkokensis]|nr:alpha/beta hydrolase [Actinokineospora bangkokensis]
MDLHAPTTGSGPVVVLLHGFPHTHRVWDPVLPHLDGSTVVTPDLRGFGDSPRVDGQDVATSARDVLDTVREERFDVVGIDAGAPVAVFLAAEHPERVRSLTACEAVLGGLPAHGFAAPWWFGFHQVPGLAETVLSGNERAYVDFFLDAGAPRGVPEDIREAVRAAYAAPGALRCAFQFYREMARSAEQVRGIGEVTVPAMAVGADVVGDVLERQLRPIAADLVGRRIRDCGHIVPLERPEVFGPLLRDFLAAQRSG